MLLEQLFPAALARTGKPVASSFARCDRCGLLKSGCRTPKMPVFGGGRRGVLIVCEQPTLGDDAAGHGLAGGAGKMFEAELRSVGVDLERDAWVTHALICQGKDTPSTAVEDCRPNILKTIKELDPQVIVPVGQMACESLIGHYWKPNVGPALRWANRQIPVRAENRWLCPLESPSEISRDRASPLLRTQFRESLHAAFALEARPWAKIPPSFDSQVEVVLSPSEAADRLKRYTSGLVAFDFETDRLKPDHPDARIICCSVCWEGKETIGFPWTKATAAEMRRIFLSPDIRKVGYNAAFEHRWVVAKLRIDVVNWVWDGMLAAHAIDPRRAGDREENERGSGTTGLKFVSFCLLGAPDYSSHLDEFLRPSGKDQTEHGANAPNRIKEIGIELLSKYCAIDSLLEFLVAKLQSREAGVVL